MNKYENPKFLALLYLTLDLSSLVERLIGRKVNIKALRVTRTCSPVDLSTCLPGLTGSEVFIGEQGIMGIPYLT